MFLEAFVERYEDVIVEKDTEMSFTVRLLADEIECVEVKDYLMFTIISSQ